MYTKISIWIISLGYDGMGVLAGLGVPVVLFDFTWFASFNKIFNVFVDRREIACFYQLSDIFLSVSVGVIMYLTNFFNLFVFIVNICD